MRKLALAMLLVFAAVSFHSVFAGDEQPQRLKKRVAVFKFEDKTAHVYSWWTGQPVGDGMADMLTTALVKSGKYRVIERQQIEDVVLKEQALGQTGVITSESAAKIGKMLGVELAIVGSVTEFGHKESEKGGRMGGIGLGGKKMSATVAVDVRFINTTTGEILQAESVRKEKSSTGLSVSTPEFDFKNEKAFDESLVGKATREAVNEIVTKIDAAAVNIPWSAKIAKLSADGSVIINSGAEAGVQVGDKFVVYRAGEEVIDPDTGESLGSEETAVGKIEVLDNNVGKGKASKCKVTSGLGLKEGDIVRLK
ncbi:MAG: CsgG/HfaB family protein [Candidatus Eisenbacteria bacterium]|nr:CsgG/HfaB family protein [Candidatus Eisenbacteria bacterium]